MNYSTTLSEWLALPDNNQSALALQIGKTQVAVSRYANGIRFPDADTARLIDKATDGLVPFATWRSDFEQRSGIGQAA